MPVHTENNIPFITDWPKAAENTDGRWPQWFKELRTANLERIAEIGFPTTKDEEWKFTNIAAATEKQFRLNGKKLSNKTEGLERYLSSDDIQLVFINGELVAEYSNTKNLPKGVTISPLTQALEKNEPALKKILGKYPVEKTTAFTALNQALSAEGVFIQIDANVHIEKLIHIVHLVNAQEPLAIIPRSIISVEKSAEATVLESHVCFNNQAVYLSNPLTDIYLAENALLHYCKAQSESMKGFHIGTTRVWQERNSNLDGFSITVGGQITRNNLDVALDGEGANTTINGLYSLNGKQLADNHTAVEHRVPNCTSNQLYKGILNGAAHAVFNGKIFVRPIAQLTNSYQLNKNLILGKDCRVDTKPQLEIYADDVKCTHGATIGQLNEDEIFYLQTRSISKKDAVTMLSRGFVDDIIETIKSEAIRKKLNILLEPTFAALE